MSWMVRLALAKFSESKPANGAIFRKGERPVKTIALLLTFITGYGFLMGQTRLNTEKLEQTFRAKISKFEAEARAFERQAKALRHRTHASEHEAEKARQELKRIDAEIARYRQIKVKAFESLIDDLMQDPEIGPLLKKNPNAIFVIDWIESAILKEPWLLNEILRILKKYQ